MADQHETASPIEWWLRPFAWLFARRPDWRETCGRCMLRLRNPFYLALALVFMGAGAWDQFVQPFDRQLSRSSFDWLMNHRPLAYRADPDILILDIDEASLASMAEEHGRWPWPRKVLAEVGAAVEAAGAQAVMYDILFSDADVANAQSEAAFDRYVAQSHGTFFPLVRLNPSNDADSDVSLAMLNFASPDPQVPAGRRNSARTVAVLPPYLKSIYDTTRCGTNNITPDSDNVVRWYPNFEPLAGYRIPSLPYRMAQVLGWPLPRQPRSLLNWPRGASPYRAVSFADAYRAAEAHDGRFFGQFRGKTVLVGSTAISLNDIKVSPVAQLHPGIDLLATAIDNTKNDSFLHPLPSLWLWIIEVALIAASTRVFWGRNRATAVTRYFFLVPGTLLALSLLSVSVSHVLLDLSVPAGLVLAYFTIAKLYETQTHDFVSGSGVFSFTAAETQGALLQVACLPASLPRAQVMKLLTQPGTALRLWDPFGSGLGSEWMRQGWVLWRWHRPGTSPEPGAAATGAVALHWRSLAPADSGTAFALARTIAEAAGQNTPSVAPERP